MASQHGRNCPEPVSGSCDIHFGWSSGWLIDFSGPCRRAQWIPSLQLPTGKMFLGDSGSMLIGLILGCVALKCSVKQYAAAALIMPTAIWAIPIFDVAMAIIRRRLTGRSIYSTDRGHLHHCLTVRGTLAVVCSWCWCSLRFDRFRSNRGRRVRK